MKIGSLLRRVSVTTLPNQKSLLKSSDSTPQICNEPEVFWKVFWYVLCESEDLLLVFRFIMVKRLIRKSWSENEIKSIFFSKIYPIYIRAFWSKKNYCRGMGIIDGVWGKISQFGDMNGKRLNGVAVSPYPLLTNASWAQKLLEPVEVSIQTFAHFHTSSRLA